MSSGGAISVVGSEVMPLDYGSMDTESSPSPTSSERRDEGVVEEEEEEIPSNVLESGGGVDGCYDPDLEIVSEVRGYVSELGSRSSLRGLVGNCNLPHHVLIKPAGVNERACSAPRDHWMPIYLHYLIAGLRGEKGWYYFGPRSSSKENRNLFSAGPSSIKGWKEKFFFLDDTEWSRKDAKVGKLVREEGDVVDILYLTSPNAIEAAELYGPSSLSEAEMDDFVNAAGGLRIPKKPRKKSTTLAAANRGELEKERLPSTSARVLEIQQRLELAGGNSEEVSEEVAPLQRKKRKVVEPEVRGDEVIEFVSRPPPSEMGPEIRERKGVEVRRPSEGAKLIPPHLYEKSLFEARNTTGVKHFLNATLPEV
ncbi:hypothetical protein SLEP1_g24485, partial [Rubroshorea leprosula]